MADQKEAITRQTFVVNTERLKKLRVLCALEDKDQKTALDEALEAYIKAYEKKHGEIKLPAKK